MTKVDPVHIIAIVKAVLAALRRSGRLPTRLDEEDYDDLFSEGTAAALMVMATYDPERGSLRAYLDKPISRAIIKESWRIANIGITGDHGSLQVFSTDAHVNDEDTSETDEYEPTDMPQQADVAEEVEAFDHVWHSRYARDVT